MNEEYSAAILMATCPAATPSVARYKKEFYVGSLLQKESCQLATVRSGQGTVSSHDVLQAGSAVPFQQVQHLLGLAPLASAGRLLRGFGALGGLSALLRRRGLLPRLGLRGRDVGLPWRDVSVRGGFRLLGRSGGRLGRLFFGIDRRHRSFSSAVDHRGHDMEHSGAREKQVNSAAIRKGDGMAMNTSQISADVLR